MKLLLVAIITLLSLSLGGGTFSPYALNSGLLAISDPSPQQTEQIAEVTPEAKARIDKLASTNPAERAEAACRLGELKATAAIPALIKLLGDDAEVQQPVCGEKHKWGNDQISKTTPGEMSAVALSRMGKQAVEPLNVALKSSDAWQARANAAFALGLIRDGRSVEPLIKATEDSAWQVRCRAVWSLGLAGDYRAVEPLTVALKDSEEKVRSQAAWALGLKGDERSVEGLIAALTDTSPQVQSQAAWALGLKGDSRAVEALTIALHANTEHVRSQAAWALGLKGDSRAVDPLIAALRDTDAHVRSQAAWALGLKGDSRAIEPLRIALNDQDDQVRKQAAWALQMRRIQNKN